MARLGTWTDRLFSTNNFIIGIISVRRPWGPGGIAQEFSSFRIASPSTAGGVHSNPDDIALFAIFAGFF
jgi:hypothetical protein